MQWVRGSTASVEGRPHTGKRHIEPDCSLAAAQEVDILAVGSSVG